MLRHKTDMTFSAKAINIAHDLDLEIGLGSCKLQVARLRIASCKSGVGFRIRIVVGATSATLVAPGATWKRVF